MEPITAIVTALAIGAASTLKETTAQAIKDAYAGLKAIIQSKYSKVAVAQLEEAPESKARRAVIEEDLTKAGAEGDEELLRQAKQLLDMIQKHAPETAGAIGVDLEDIKPGTQRYGSTGTSSLASICLALALVVNGNTGGCSLALVPIGLAITAADGFELFGASSWLVLTNPLGVCNLTLTYP